MTCRIVLLSVILLGIIRFTYQLDSRIVGGHTARLEDSKYMVSLRIKSNDKGSNFGDGHTCGGALIGTSKVLTAAHCIWNKKSKRFRKPGDFQVVMGTTDRFVKTNETLVLKVSKIVIPKTYNPEAYKDDVAVMLLKGSVPKNYRFIEPIEMNNHAVKTGTLCNVTGWGSMKEAGVMPNFLLTVDVPIVDTLSCHMRYLISGGLDEGQMCAGYPEGGKDSCQGDSGGPLVCDGLLAGIVSYGNGCARRGIPGVYSNVTYYKKWIDDQNSSTTFGTSLLMSFVCFVLVNIFM